MGTKYFGSCGFSDDVFCIVNQFKEFWIVIDAIDKVFVFFSSADKDDWIDSLRCVVGIVGIEILYGS